MKTVIIALFSLSIVLPANAQNPADQAKYEEAYVNRWVYDHPEVKLVSLDHFYHVSSGERQELIALDFLLVYSGDKVTYDEIQAFESTGMTSEVGNLSELDEEISKVKEWLELHPEVKLVTYDFLQTLTPGQREEYLTAPGVIVYTGRLSLHDIKNYESN